MFYLPTFRSCLLTLLISVFLFAPSLYAFAQEQVGPQNDNDEQVGPESEVNFEPVTLNNPLNDIDSLEDLIVALLNIFITLMIPVIVFFIIYAGFKYVVAQGNPGKIEEAHQTLLYVIIGGVLVLAAVAIAEIIKNTVAAF